MAHSLIPFSTNLPRPLNRLAECKQGILKVTVPKSEAAMPKRIEVKTE